LNVDVKTDLEILNETLLRYRHGEDLSVQERLVILSDLEYYLHQVTLTVCYSCSVTFILDSSHYFHNLR